ncbi:site-specific recombinase [Streptomyces litchfieldiae]|uniref:Site-specific recombinase n=1 Tax=Streptomyces litchfieldiae TaxID=3075543 RepID=A0ABU2MII5_9ACTN|nr:site-specific recombinase [Streptomyces sp. DSM 44938]MDT0341281.1 site-specific recombinase [Streptomyces sp. DSM 44938]
MAIRHMSAPENRTAPAAPPPTYAAAVDHYLAGARVMKSSAWIHRISLTTWGWLFSGRPAPIGPDRHGTTPAPFSLAAVAAPGLPPVLAELAAARADFLDADTVRRELSIARKAIGWWLARGWITSDPTVGIERRPAPPDRAGALAGSQLGALWRLNAPVREKTLWRLVHESGARADEVLCLNVEDLFTAEKCGRIATGGGAVRWIHWRSGTARLLPRLIAGRTRGPLFLADEEAPAWIPEPDRCPVTGRARLSHRRAEKIFEASTRLLANPLARPEDFGELEGWRSLHRLHPGAAPQVPRAGWSGPRNTTNPVSTGSGAFAGRQPRRR